MNEWKTYVSAREESECNPGVSRVWRAGVWRFGGSAVRRFAFSWLVRGAAHSHPARPYKAPRAQHISFSRDALTTSTNTTHSLTHSLTDHLPIDQSTDRPIVTRPTNSRPTDEPIHQSRTQTDSQIGSEHCHIGSID